MFDTLSILSDGMSRLGTLEIDMADLPDDLERPNAGGCVFKLEHLHSIRIHSPSHLHRRANFFSHIVLPSTYHISVMAHAFDLHDVDDIPTIRPIFEPTSASFRFSKGNIYVTLSSTPTTPSGTIEFTSSLWVFRSLELVDEPFLRRYPLLESRS